MSTVTLRPIRHWSHAVRFFGLVALVGVTVAALFAVGVPGASRPARPVASLASVGGAAALTLHGPACPFRPALADGPVIIRRLQGR